MIPMMTLMMTLMMKLTSVVAAFADVVTVIKTTPEDIAVDVDVAVAAAAVHSVSY
jgi:hypothetical protein